MDKFHPLLNYNDKFISPALILAILCRSMFEKKLSETYPDRDTFSCHVVALFVIIKCLGGGRIALRTKGFLCKHGDLSSDPQRPGRKQSSQTKAGGPVGMLANHSH